MQGSTIIPALRYNDAHKAIRWLCENLGFEKRAVHGDDHIVHHAQLTFGSGMIMIGSYRKGEYDQFISLPMHIQNQNTQSAYLYVEDINGYYTKVSEKGVVIVLPYKEEPHGTGFSCRDPEGHLWSFGDYNPWITEDHE